MVYNEWMATMGENCSFMIEIAYLRTLYFIGALIDESYLIPGPTFNNLEGDLLYYSKERSIIQLSIKNPHIKDDKAVGFCEITITKVDAKSTKIYCASGVVSPATMPVYYLQAFHLQDESHVTKEEIMEKFFLENFVLGKVVDSDGEITQMIYCDWWLQSEIIQLTNAFRSYLKNYLTNKLRARISQRDYFRFQDEIEATKGVQRELKVGLRTFDDERKEALERLKSGKDKTAAIIRELTDYPEKGYKEIARELSTTVPRVTQVAWWIDKLFRPRGKTFPRQKSRKPIAPTTTSS